MTSTTRATSPAATPGAALTSKSMRPATIMTTGVRPAAWAAAAVHIAIMRKMWVSWPVSYINWSLLVIVRVQTSKPFLQGLILILSHEFEFNWYQGDECGSMEEFGAPLSVKYSFSNFSFKVNYYLKNSLFHCIRVFFSESCLWWLNCPFLFFLWCAEHLSASIHELRPDDEA